VRVMNWARLSMPERGKAELLLGKVAIVSSN
jgi:hypothetical protein